MPLLVEVFGLWLTLGRCPGAPIGGGLWSLSDLGRCPLPLLWGLCHIGLVEQMVVCDKLKERIVR